MTWIKFSERLPVEGQEVLIIDDDDYIQIGKIDDGELVCREYMEIPDATHWMAFPIVSEDLK